MISESRYHFEKWVDRHIEEPDLDGLPNKVDEWRYNSELIQLCWKAWSLSYNTGYKDGFSKEVSHAFENKFKKSAKEKKVK